MVFTFYWNGSSPALNYVTAAAAVATPSMCNLITAMMVSKNTDYSREPTERRGLWFFFFPFFRFLSEKRILNSDMSARTRTHIHMPPLENIITEHTGYIGSARCSGSYPIWPITWPNKSDIVVIDSIGARSNWIRMRACMRVSVCECVCTTQLLAMKCFKGICTFHLMINKCLVRTMEKRTERWQRWQRWQRKRYWSCEGCSHSPCEYGRLYVVYSVFTLPMRS